MISKSPRCFLPSFKSIGLSVQEKKQKIDFQAGGHGAHLGFPIGTFSLFLIYVTPMLPTKFQINWSFGSREEAKIDFQDGGHLVFPIGTILAIFDNQVDPMFPTKFQIHWYFGSGEDDLNNFSYL